MSKRPRYAAEIGDDLIRQAAALTDLNESCALLQNAVGITDGGIAALHFSGQCPNPDGSESRNFLDWDDAWPLIPPEAREAELRAYLALEDAFRPAEEDRPTVRIAGESMTILAAATDLKVGDVVVNTQVLESYPTYFIEPGARFVVVGNELDGPNGILDIRLTPLDASHMRAGDLREWGNCVQIFGPEYQGYENDPGVDPLDRTNPGNIWTKATIPLRKNNDLLPLDHRVAAVFTYLLARDINDNMAVVVRRNASEESALVCHSHDFCDANVIMSSAIEKVLGRPVWLPWHCTRGDCTEGEHKSDVALWNGAWELAKKSYFSAYDRDPEDDLENDDQSSPRYEAFYSQRGQYWYVDLRDNDGGTTVAGASGALSLTEGEAHYIAERLNAGDPLALVLARRRKPKAENPLAAPLLDLLQYVGGWDIVDPEHPVVKARLAYEGATGTVLNGSGTDVEFRPLTEETVWRHCRQLGVNADYCILYQRAEGYDGWSPFATCAPETIDLIKKDGIRVHARLVKLLRP